MAATHIDSEIIRNQKPTFPELWDDIKTIMDSSLLIAHNAPFDMGVLAKSWLCL